MSAETIGNILNCLGLSEDKWHRILTETEVASQIVVGTFSLKAGVSIQDEVNNFLDELADFGECIQIIPDPNSPSIVLSNAVFSVVAIIPSDGMDQLQHLLNKPCFERFVIQMTDNRNVLGDIHDHPSQHKEMYEDPHIDDLVQHARNYILSPTQKTRITPMTDRLPSRQPPEKLSVVTFPRGFRASGVRCGIKTKGCDLGILLSDHPARSASVYTQNRFCSPSVELCREYQKKGGFQAIVASSGIANAGTGGKGKEDARRMGELAAEKLGLSPEKVAVCNTGVIGKYLPMDKITSGINQAFESLRTDNDEYLIEAIMTTDTFMKYASVEVVLDGTPVRFGGIVKGSGMIHPNLATMFAFLTTDANVSQSALEQSLKICTADTFNCLTVDGDTSPSDSVILIANGASGGREIGVDSPHYRSFLDTLRRLCDDLVRQMARDGEGATHLVKISCVNAFSRHEAVEVAKTIGMSLLVKTALFGKDPNWGRIVSAIGRTEARFENHMVKVWLAGHLIFENNMPVPFDRDVVSGAMAEDEVEIRVDLGAGPFSATIFTCDLSYDYVRINAEYHT